MVYPFWVRDHTTGILSRCKPVLPLHMIRREIFSESLVDINRFSLKPPKLLTDSLVLPLKYQTCLISLT